jgi:hypothetical protein
MLDPNSKLITIEKPYKLTIEDNSKKLFLREEKKIINLIAQQGLPGIPGDGNNFVCSEEIDFGDILYFKTGTLYKASYDSLDLKDNFIVSFFMAQGSSTIPNSEIFCRFKGRLTFSTPHLIPDSIYYLGLNGKISLTPPTSGVMLVIGNAITETDFFLNIQQPILLR